ncbi:MAG: hydantoinase B/oxoprolinase family protein [Planctomycetota bacterium]
MNEFCFSIDRGGTFTDIYAWTPQGTITLKLLSENPLCYPDAPREGIRRILSRSLRQEIDPTCIDESPIRWIRMGTTVATNALLERKGEPLLWITTQGFRDLLRIGTQSRPNIFALQILLPELIYQDVLEVEERVYWIPAEETPNYPFVKQGISGEWYRIEQPLSLPRLEEQLKRVYQNGIRSLAVSLLHGYDFQEHEQQIKKLAQHLGFSQISLSSEICPQIKLLQRGDTTTLDAYLTPRIRQYLESFRQGFKHQLRNTQVLFMQSHGGLISASHCLGSRSVLSGPAGGVVGYSLTTPTLKPLIGFDMGGTSTDVSRFDQVFESISETEISGIRLQIPQLHIRTVAAGGGSRLFFQDGKFQVGPESVGANPGPVCYGKGGFLAITDANLLLGRIVAKEFPAVFGPQENQPLDVVKTREAMEKFTHSISQQTGISYSYEQVAYGFIQVANELMARPIREISSARGYDLQEHQLVCFGGASGQHACAIAKKLGIQSIFIHQYASILSAVGLSLADWVQEKSLPCYGLLFSSEHFALIEEKWRILEALLTFELPSEGISEVLFEHALNLRLQGSSHAIKLTLRQLSETTEAFKRLYQQEFGFQVPHNRTLLVDDIAVRCIGKTAKSSRLPIEKATQLPPIQGYTRVYEESDWSEIPYFSHSQLKANHSILGPAIILLEGTSVFVEKNCSAKVNEWGDIEIKVEEGSSQKLSEQANPIYLSIFHHLFMSIAEQMGRNLQRVAVSTNIKERLDFSCAIFSAEGSLVANAPHIPVHLGAMGESVRFLMQRFQGQLTPGEVLVTNDPYHGGSHLPDITVVTPVWENNEILFFVASRGHHADIGGITPGSMPPFSTCLQEEGICLEGLKLVEQGRFQEERLQKYLTTPFPLGNKTIPGSRKVDDNLSDLRAQVAANQKGVSLLEEMIRHYGKSIVLAYMQHIQDNAESVIRQVIQEFKERFKGKPLTAIDWLDDGSQICLTVEFLEQGNIRFDFSGTDPELLGNLNAPRAITTSAILYVLRSLVNRDIPLNAGCLKPVEIYIPDHTLLSPSWDSAVVGGNVETSQRVVDVILKALQVAAGSQGTMNNFSFGNEQFGYYETIAGGEGASANHHGQHAVHTHMTNTKITDPEILERLYPVLLRKFSIRQDSGGAGAYSGGDGIIREMEFCEPMELSILSERRTFPPYGLLGGLPGKTGKNLLFRANGRPYKLGGKASLKVYPGDRIRLETPGGGGYGSKP